MDYEKSFSEVRPTEQQLQILHELPYNLDSINRALLKQGLINNILTTPQDVSKLLTGINDHELLYKIHTEAIGMGSLENQKNFGGLIVTPLEIVRDSYVLAPNLKNCKTVAVDWVPSGTEKPNPNLAISISKIAIEDLKRMVEGIESELADDAQVVCKTRPDLADWLIRKFGFEIDPDPKHMTTTSSSKKEDEPGSDKISLTITFAKLKEIVKSLEPVNPDMIVIHRRKVLERYAGTFRKDEYPRHYL